MIEPVVLFLVGVGIIALRTFARVRVVGWKHLESDDYIMFFVALFYATGTVLTYISGTYWHSLNNGGMTPEERAALDPTSEEYQWRVKGSKAYIAIWVSFSLVLWLQKVAMLAFFVRLTSRLGDFTKMIRLGFLFVAAGYMAIVLCFFLDCLPLERTWQINPYPGNSCVPSDTATLAIVLTLNIATDVYILAIPLPVFWMAQIKLWKKLGLLVLISGNIFIIAISVVRVCIIVGDPLYGSRLAAPWTYRVMFVSVVSTNAPLLAPLIRKWCSCVSVLLYGENKTVKGMMREIQRITVVDCIVDDDETAQSELALSRKARPQVHADQGRRASVFTYGSRTIVAADDGDSETITAVLEGGPRDHDPRLSVRAPLSDEHPV